MPKPYRLMPKDPQLCRLRVLRSQYVSPSMIRVTVGGPGLADFTWRGFDHWFRLFVRLPHTERFDMPDIPGRRWWPAYLDIPEENRPHFSNYTVADFRAHCLEMDIDLVVHRGPDGDLEGPAAIWACAAEPGEELAILDQGVMFDRPDDASDLLIVADESGLPATAGILRSLPDGVTGLVIQEVPTASDRRALRTPSGMTVRWVIRAEVEAPDGSIPGRAALAHLHEHTDVDPTGYAFVVGESTLATQGRRHLVRRGMPKGRITFSGFWKHAGTPA